MGNGIWTIGWIRRRGRIVLRESYCHLYSSPVLSTTRLTVWAAYHSYSSFIESHGQSLIDLSLYVSSENYTAATRPAYGSLLSWPNQWILPPKIRDSAKARTDHLGLSSLDLDAAEEERQRTREADNVAAAQIPKSLVKQPRDTVSSLLSKTSQQNRIRLDGMTGAFAAPLEALQNGKRHLLSDELVSSVDCLALGYLSLAVVPDVPFAWLRDTVQSEAAGLVRYTERLRGRCFGGPVDAAEPTRGEQQGAQLPWQAREQVTLGRVGIRAWDSLMDSIPVIGEVRASRRLQQAGRELAGREEQGAISEVARAQRYNTYMSVAGVVSGLGLLAWSMFNAGWITVLSTGDGEQQEEDDEEGGSGSAAWGEAGSVLGL